MCALHITSYNITLCKLCRVLEKLISAGKRDYLKDKINELATH
jgi:hypothetical protein